MTEVYEKELAESVLEVALEANKWILEGDEGMFESLLEMMEPQLQLREERIRRESMEKGMEKGIRGMVVALREFGIGDAQIKTAIIKNYGLSEAEAGKYL